MAKKELNGNDLAIVKAKIIAAAKESLKSWLEILKQDGKDQLEQGKQFAKASENLLKDLVKGNISKEEFDDAMDDIGKALMSHLIAESYSKTRKHLAFLVNTIKMLAEIAMKLVI